MSLTLLISQKILSGRNETQMHNIIFGEVKIDLLTFENIVPT